MWNIAIVKAIYSQKKSNLRFESYVISYRTKTLLLALVLLLVFESYVISYRTKTVEKMGHRKETFESYVISYRT